jgi:uncharacterized protein (TIGR02266 family)
MKDFSFIKATEESAINLSQGGAFIRMDEPYPSGTLVKFKIRTPDDTIIDGVGKVAWLREKQNAGPEPAGVGIRFLKMSDESRAILEKILENAKIVVPDYPDTKAQKETPAAPAKAMTSPAEDMKAERASRPSQSARPSQPARPSQSARPSRPSQPFRPSSQPSRPSRSSAPMAHVVSKSVPPTAIEPERESIPEPITETVAEPIRPSEPEPIQLSTPEAIQPSDAGGDTAGMPAPETILSLGEEDRLSSKSPAAPKAGKPSAWIIGLVIVAAIAGGAWVFMGKTTKPTPVETKAPPSIVQDDAPPPQEEEPAPPVQEAKPADPQEAAPAAAQDAPALTPADAEAAKPVIADEAVPAANQISVEVSTLPPGAALSVDGKQQEGVSPLTLHLEKNKEVEITAKFAGYLTQSVKVVAAEELPPVNIDLAPARIKFQMTSQPSGARIIIDGKFNGTTPYTFLRKKYKPDYQYRIEKKGFQAVEGTVAEDQWVEDGRYYIFTLDAVLPPAE